ncbi:hypothetical protein protein [Bacillus cereus G9241]|nr:hypothetical protein protein [Bacillus cereus G9241]
MGVSGVVIIVGAVILIGGSLLWVIEWIYRNMP